MIAGPIRIDASLPGFEQIAYNVSIRIKDTDRRNAAIGNIFLPSALPKQVLWLKDGLARIVLAQKQINFFF
jgi:hypothetical protein